MDVTTTRQIPARPSFTKVRDEAGHVWRHDNPAELYRWVSRRNELIRTIAAASRPHVGAGRAVSPRPTA